VTTTTYEWNLAPQTVAESVAGTTQRVTTTTHDESGRATASRIVDSVPGDQVVADTVDVYSSTIVLQTATELVSGDTITRDTLASAGTVTSSTATAFDANGRESTFADASGAISSFYYDVNSRQVQEWEHVTGQVAGISNCTTFGGTDALGNTEDRSLATSQSIIMGGSCLNANPGVSKAAYDADGNATTLVYPNGMVATTRFNQSDQATQLAYTQGASGVGSGYGATVMTFSQSYNQFGQVATASSPESNQVYAYDGASRLVGVGDNLEGTCTTRTYGLDADSNRTAFTSAASTPNGSGQCPTATAASPIQTVAYDAGASTGGSDRVLTSTWGTNVGTYAYDVLGRETSIPSVDTGTGGSTTAGSISTTYRADDLVSTMAENGSSETFTYDPNGNVLSTATVAGTGSNLTTGTTTNYYDGGRSPAWTKEANGTVTVYFDAISQGNALDVTLGQAGTSCLGSTAQTCTVNLSDLRGDIIATASITPGTGSVSGYSEQTEFGQPRSQSVQSAVAPVYGWLGTHQKAANNLSGLVLKGVRVYNPTTGAFSSPDPMLEGNAGPYVYPGDPINEFDLNGQCWICSIWHATHRAARWVGHEVRKHWRGLLTIAEVLGAFACIAATGGGCALGVSGAFLALNTVINATDRHGDPFGVAFWKGEVVDVAASALLYGGGANYDSLLGHSWPIWEKAIARGTVASVDAIYTFLKLNAR
jgi:RHS repeat-associated protein